MRQSITDIFDFGDPEKGKPNPAQEMCFELDICPDLLLAAAAAAAAAIYLALYTAITAAGRKKRSAADTTVGFFLDTLRADFLRG